MIEFSSLVAVEEHQTVRILTQAVRAVVYKVVTVQTTGMLKVVTEEHKVLEEPVDMVAVFLVTVEVLALVVITLTLMALVVVEDTTVVVLLAPDVVLAAAVEAVVLPTFRQMEVP